MLVKKNELNVNSLLQKIRNGKRKIAGGPQKMLFYVENPPETAIPLWDLNLEGRELPENETQGESFGRPAPLV